MDGKNWMLFAICPLHSTPQNGIEVYFNFIFQNAVIFPSQISFAIPFWQ